MVQKDMNIYRLEIQPRTQGGMGQKSRPTVQFQENLDTKDKCPGNPQADREKSTEVRYKVVFSHKEG